MSCTLYSAHWPALTPLLSQVALNRLGGQIGALASIVLVAVPANRGSAGNRVPLPGCSVCFRCFAAADALPAGCDLLSLSIGAGAAS